MLKFDLSSHRIVVDPKSLMISELRECYDNDPDPLKRGAIDVLSYVHLVSQIDPSAPYFSAREDEVETLAAIDIFGRDYDKRLVILDSFLTLTQAYQKAFEKPENRIVKTFNHKLDQLQDMLADVKPEIQKSINGKTGTFTFVSNTRAIMQVMKDLDEVMDAKEQLEERIKDKRLKEVKIRGNKKESFLEKTRMAEAGRRTRTFTEGAPREEAPQPVQEEIPIPQENQQSDERITEEQQPTPAKATIRRPRKNVTETETMFSGAGPNNF